MKLFLSNEILNHLMGLFDKTHKLHPITPFDTLETLIATSESETYDMGLIDASHVHKRDLDDIRELFPNLPLVLCCRDLVGFEMAKEQGLRSVDEILYISQLDAVHFEQMLELIYNKHSIKKAHSELKVQVSKQDMAQREHFANVAHQQQALLKLAQLKFKADTLEHTFENIGFTVQDTLGIECFSIWLMDSHLEELKCQCLITQEGYQPSDGIQVINRSDFPDYFDRLEKGSVLILDDLKESMYYKIYEGDFYEACHGVMEAPLFEDGVIYGMIRFEERDQPRKWSIEETYFADVVSDMVTMAIDQWKAHQSEEEHRRKEEILRQKLEKSNLELQDFTSIVSHDLQEPLYKINAFGELLEERMPQYKDEEALFFIQRIRHSTQRLQHLIKDLLSFSRVQSQGKNFESIDLNLSMITVLGELEIRILEKGATVNTDKLPKVMADETQMQQLFQNILSNALKFTQEEEHPQIDVTYELDKKNNAHILNFQDNGIGIEAEDEDKIFGVFQRLYNSDEFEGTGMGLAIVDRIVKRHGWKVSAHGKLGEGTCIRIEIPIHKPK